MTPFKDYCVLMLWYNVDVLAADVRHCALIYIIIAVYL